MLLSSQYTFLADLFFLYKNNFGSKVGIQL